MSKRITASARALFLELIDYAGLFPPAALSMPEAVTNYATYRNSNYNWMLSRFVVPVNRLDEFTENAKDFFGRDEMGSWKISVLASEDVGETLRRIADFNSRYIPFAVCDAIELKAETGSAIEKIAAALPTDLNAFFELPLAENLGDLAATLAICRQNAKIRTGGVTPDAFPAAEQVARFMRTCLAANVAFKATAGLHHPVRCTRPLTYEKNAPTGVMHGFLNVFLAAGFLRQGLKTRLIRRLLHEESPKSFAFDDKGVRWGSHFLSTAEIDALRRRNAISFGSCSFDEPVADVRQLGLL